MMMCRPLPLFLLALSYSLAAPYDEYPEVVVPQKRAALVLDRLLVALQNALEDDASTKQLERSLERDGPRAAPLRTDANDMVVKSALQRRGQTSTGRGRVLRCYFNAVTCF